MWHGSSSLHLGPSLVPLCAVRMVEEHREAHASEWAVLQSVAPKLGCTAETLRKWVRQAQRDAGHRPGLTTSERERLKELEREEFPPRYRDRV